MVKVCGTRDKIMEQMKDKLNNTQIDRLKSEYDLLVESNKDLKSRVQVLEQKPEAGSDRERYLEIQA